MIVDIINSNFPHEIRVQSLDKCGLRHKPVNKLHFYFICDSNGVIPDAITQNFEQAAQCCTQFNVLYIIAADIKQLADSFLVIVFTAHPFQDDISGKHKCCAAYCQVITEPLKFIPEIQQ